MTEMFGEAWSPMSVPDLAPDDDDEYQNKLLQHLKGQCLCFPFFFASDLSCKKFFLTCKLESTLSNTIELKMTLNTPNSFQNIN